MSVNAVNRFLRAAKRLSQLYDFSMHCSTHVVEHLQEQLAAGEIEPVTHIKSQHGFLPHHRVATTLQRAKDYFPKELRSVILVRLVSEFEVFLISLLREVASISGEVFRKDARLEWERSRVLSFSNMEELKYTFISHDCRTLSSGGFDEIVKYYKKYLSIDIMPPGSKLENVREIHARRHIHVHNGGLVDEKYTHEYGSKEPIGSVLQISEQYLRAALATFRLMAVHVAREADRKFPAPKSIRKNGALLIGSKGQILYFATAKFKSDNELKSYFDTARMLRGVDGVKLLDVFVGATITGMTAEWTIIGDENQLKGFFIDLRYFESRGWLRLVSVKRLTPK